MANVSVSCNTLTPKPTLPLFPSHNHLLLRFPIGGSEYRRSRPTLTIFAAKSGVSFLKKCQKCEGKGAVECPGCKGTGKNKKNGNIFERWKCFDCQGFGMKSCPSCGKGGLTPEQRGER